MAGHGMQEEDETIGEINVIPFIDICLVLLIIVLMTSASQADFKKIALPKGNATEFKDMNLAVTLTVDEKGEFYFEESPEAISAKKLWMFLKSIQGETPWRMMVIRTDQNTPYEYMALAVQCAQSLGCEDINFAVKDIEQEEAEKGGAS